MPAPGRAGLVRRALFRSFRLLWAAEAWGRARFTPAGRLVLAGLGASAIVGVDTNRTVAYQVFALLAALLALALGSALLFRGRFAVRRALPRLASAGQPFSYRLTVENLTGRPQVGLVVREALADPRPAFREFLRAREPGEERRNWFDRAVGYPRWAWLVEARRLADPADVALPPLRPREAVDVQATLTPRRRGILRLTGVSVARPDPLGLFKAALTLPAPASVLVLPRCYPVPPLSLPGRRRYQRGGVALAASVGDSEEFAALREYRPGDPLRRVHWKSWARLGKPIVKEFQDEFFVRHALVLDTFTPEVGSRRFEEAVSVAASFAVAIPTQESLLDLLFVGPEAYALTAGRGVAHAERMLEILAGVQPCGDRPFALLRGLVLDRCGALSGAICVLLGWDEERRALVEALQARGVPALALVVTDGGGLPAAAGPAAGPDADGAPRVLEVGRIAEGLAAL
jgi:uncharacterized protein (DUF58 family)